MLEGPHLIFLAAGGDRSVLYDLFFVLAAAALVAMVLERMRLAAIPGYLLTGVLVGPGALGFVDSPTSLSLISNLAIILLMFGIGLHFDLNAVKRDLGAMIAVGAGSCVLTVLLALPVAWIAGISVPAACALGMALSLSSTAVVLKIIAARRDLRRPSGRLAFAILIVQDLMVVGMLAVLPLLSRWSDAAGSHESLPPWSWIVVSTALSCVGVAGLVVLGRLVLPYLLNETARGRSREVMMILSVSAAIGAAVITNLLGFSAEMGAFLAGFLLSSTHFRHELRGQIGPLRDLFMAVFFTTVGMKLNLGGLIDAWWIVLIGSICLCGLKGAAIGFVAWALGASGSVAIIVGFSLAQAGEFSLVLLERSLSLEVVSTDVAANAIAIVVMSLIFTPTLVALGHRLAAQVARSRSAPWILSSRGRDRWSLEDDDAGPAVKPVIIAGYGTVGRTMAETLTDRGTPFTIVELNPATVREEARTGQSIVFGNIADPEILSSVDVEHAEALVLTVPDDEAALRACQAARHLAPDLYIAVRTGFPQKGERARELGANHVAVEEITVAESLCRAVLEHMGERTAESTETPPVRITGEREAEAEEEVELELAG